MRRINLFKINVDVEVWGADRSDKYIESWFLSAETYSECTEKIAKYLDGISEGTIVEVKSIELLSKNFICAE